MNQIPKIYREPLKEKLPYDIDFFIPGWEKHCPKGQTITFAPEKIECENWYNLFIDNLIMAIENPRHFPICRLGDGEFIFMFGEILNDIRYSPFRKIRNYLSNLKRIFLLRGGIKAYTVNRYTSGSYSKKEWITAKQKYPTYIKNIFKEGVIAGITFVTKKPFGERYFPIFAKFLNDYEIEIDKSNYVPFYFPYTAVVGKRRREILENRRVLVVNGFCNEKYTKVKKHLYSEGVKSVDWLRITRDKSFFEFIDIDRFKGKIDLILLGAGLGKPNIFSQLKGLNVPCIDIGYIFEVWVDPENSESRPFTVLDSSE